MGHWGCRNRHRKGARFLSPALSGGPTPATRAALARPLAARIGAEAPGVAFSLALLPQSSPLGDAPDSAERRLTGRRVLAFHGLSYSSWHRAMLPASRDFGQLLPLNLSCRGRRRPRNQRGMSTGSRMESRNTSWSAHRSSRFGRSWESKCSSKRACHSGLDGWVVASLRGGAGDGCCFLSLTFVLPSGWSPKQPDHTPVEHSAQVLTLNGSAVPGPTQEAGTSLTTAWWSREGPHDGHD